MKSQKSDKSSLIFLVIDAREILHFVFPVPAPFAGGQ